MVSNNASDKSSGAFYFYPVKKEIVHDLRKEYKQAQLNIENVAEKPMEQFSFWFNEARSAEILEPNAFVLSTANHHIPHARTVLVKEIEEDGFIFYTNYNSEKGQQINKNNHVAANFTWLDLERQIRFTGTCHKVSAKQSDNYFQNRPRNSQIGAWASKQSEILKNREALENQWNFYTKKFENQNITQENNFVVYGYFNFPKTSGFFKYLDCFLDHFSIFLNILYSA